MKYSCQAFYGSILCTVLMMFTSCASSKENKWEVSSPNSAIKMTVQLETTANRKTVLVYQVDQIKEGTPETVIEKSPLGIIRKDQSFTENLSFVVASEIKIIDETYNMVIGRQSVIKNNANELELTFKNESGSLIQMVLRAYNDGVAFRYVFPEKSDSLYTVTSELTGFKIPVNGKAWIQPYDVPSQFTPAYEKFYENGMSIGAASPNKEGWAFPALFNSNNKWILISEANLASNYCGIRMEQNAAEGLYKVRFPDPRDAEGFGEVEPKSTLPWDMPWRTIIIGNSLATIVESQMIYNVSEAQIPGDFSWVKPGKSSWSWLSDNPSPKNYNSLKEFVDLAAEMNWEYSLVDANWDLMTGGNIEELVKYAHTKGVGVLMWYNSGGPQNKITERPRDIISDPQRRREEFKKLQAWGVKGVKIDFWQSDKQNLINQYLDVLKDAAEFQIMVNFHGCTIPRGWSRTYPHVVTMESVRGEECYLFDSTFTNNAPIQNTILPFTRNAIGPMDYTPGGFTNFKYPHITTFAHEVALTLVFNSGIIHFADNVKAYQSLPEFVKDFLRTVPVTFDETRYISGEPGKYVVLASRKGKDWYISGINGQKDIMDLTIEIPYLTESQYKLNLITDGTDDKSFANELKEFNAGNKITLNMLGNGGFVAVLSAK